MTIKNILNIWFSLHWIRIMHFQEFLGSTPRHECFQFPCTSSPTFQNQDQIHHEAQFRVFLSPNTTNSFILATSTHQFLPQESPAFILFETLPRFPQLQEQEYQKLPQSYHHYFASCRRLWYFLDSCRGLLGDEIHDHKDISNAKKQDLHPNKANSRKQLPSSCTRSWKKYILKDLDCFSITCFSKGTIC